MSFLLSSLHCTVIGYVARFALSATFLESCFYYYWDELSVCVIFNSEELGSDEDDIDEDGQEYLEILAKQAGEDGDDEDWEEDDAEETALEGYSTIIDDEDNPIDEYQIFKTIFQSK